jgi:rubrerythrin
MTMGNEAVLDYLDTELPEMLGSMDEESCDQYERFANTVRYFVGLNAGAKPKYHKGMHGKKYDYWTCGKCGALIRDGVLDDYCGGCGTKILWDIVRCLTGYKEAYDGLD